MKPANLFATRSGAVKVLDFGIARLRDITAPIQSTRTGAMLGTPAFMAREQALGETDRVDERTDVWAAGATLFTLLTGELVHRGDNARQVMVRAATEPPRDVAEVAPELPLAVVEIVRRALRPEKNERFESAAAMRDAVRAAHEALFGAFDAARIRALFEGRFSALASSPTEASPDLASDPSVRAPDEVVSSLASQTVSEPRGVADSPPSRVRVGPLALGAAALLGAALLLVTLRSKQSELQPKPHLPSAALVTAPPLAPTHEETSVKVAVTTDAPAPVTRDPSTPSPNATGTASTRKPARPVRPKPPVPASATSAAPTNAEKKRENPLLIEIQ